jgi:predicted transcriptional regulator
METQTELKQELHEIIEQIKDVNILKAISVILKKEREHEKNDFYDALNPSLQASIDRGLAQIKSGETFPHEEVRKRYEKWLK